MKTLHEIFTGDLSRSEKLCYRLLPIMAIGALAAGAGVAAPAIYPHLKKDYGCATTKIPAGGGSIDATLAAREPLGLPMEDPNLQGELTYAAQTAQSQFAASHDGAAPDPGQPVETCVSYNPFKFGSSGWAATAHLITPSGQ